MIRDAWAPGHRGFQQWDGGYTEWNLPGPMHAASDFDPGPLALHDALEDSLRLLKDWATNSSALGDPANYFPPHPCRWRHTFPWPLY
jgi:hypothetical protein